MPIQFSSVQFSNEARIVRFRELMDLAEHVHAVVWACAMHVL